MSKPPREEAKTELQANLTSSRQSALKKYQMMVIGPHRSVAVDKI